MSKPDGLESASLASGKVVGRWLVDIVACQLENNVTVNLKTYSVVTPGARGEDSAGPVTLFPIERHQWQAKFDHLAIL